jgi:hypothetical protein
VRFLSEQLFAFAGPAEPSNYQTFRYSWSASAIMTVTISKSRFLAGRQCVKRLYFQVHQPELADPDGAAEAIMDQGREVGLLAH